MVCRIWNRINFFCSLSNIKHQAIAVFSGISPDTIFQPERFAIENICRPGPCIPARRFHASIGAIRRKSIAATPEEEGAAPLAVSASALRTRRAEMSLAPFDSIEHFVHEMLYALRTA